MEVEELVMPPGSTHHHHHPKLLMTVSRPVGQNDVGMLAWALAGSPQGRKVRGPGTLGSLVIQTACLRGVEVQIALHPQHTCLHALWASGNSPRSV